MIGYTGSGGGVSQAVLDAAVAGLVAAIATKQDVGSSAALSLTAGEALGGHRGVYGAADGKAYYADCGAAPARSLLGVTTGAASSGGAVAIQADGVLVNVGWSWIGTDPVWLGTAGQLTQTPPTSGYLVQVGVPVGPTKLLVAPQFIAFIGG